MDKATSSVFCALALAVSAVVAGGTAELSLAAPALAQSGDTSPMPASDAGLAPSSAPSASESTAPSPPAPESQQPSSASKSAPPASPAGIFSSRILSGGALSALVVDVQPGDLPRLPERKIVWRKPSTGALDCDPHLLTPEAEPIHSKSAGEPNSSTTVLSVPVPAPPCTWPPYQYARLTVVGDVTGRDEQTLFDGTVRVSVWWFPFVLALGTIGLIYPGCALIAWHLARRRLAKISTSAGASATIAAATMPSFWGALDPVQITASAYGRASLAKLQIFVFSLIVFGLLLYYQVRNGVLSGLSKDVLLLLGISAVGTVGGRATLIAKRRLSLDNWAWLSRKGWFPPPIEGTSCDVARRAKWRELLIDSDHKEFDIYSFQMAIFSLVVATALATSSLTGLATFEIPPELLALLGLSQVVFIGGKAAEKSPYNELDKQLDSLRGHERKYQEARARAQGAEPVASKAKTEAAAERDAFKTDAKQAAAMFWALYGEMIPQKPEALGEVDALEPDVH